MWDEAFVFFHFPQTRVNSGWKGESTLKSVAWQPGSQWPVGLTETPDPGYSKFKSASYRMFTKSMQNEMEANSMENLNLRITGGKPFLII